MKKTALFVNLAVWAVIAACFGALLALGGEAPVGGIAGSLLELYAPAFLAYAIGVVLGLVFLLASSCHLRRDIRTICRVVTVIILAGIAAALVPPAASSGKMAFSTPLLILTYATMALPLPLCLGVVYALCWAAPKEYVANETLRSERRERLEAAMEEARRVAEAERAAAREAAEKDQAAEGDQSAEDDQSAERDQGAEDDQSAERDQGAEDGRAE